MYSSSGSLRCGLVPMARPAQALQICVVVITTSSFWLDVINGNRRYCPASLQAQLTEVIVTAEDAHTSYLPFAAITALVAAASLLMLLPAFVAVCFAIT